MFVEKTKKTMIGLEVELFTLDSDGNLIHESDKLFELLKGRNLSHHLREEISFSMVELGAKPGEHVRSTARAFLENLRTIVEVAEKNDIYLLPLGCYPAKSIPKFRKKPWYDQQVALFGKKKMRYAEKVCGFHFHYSLPKGIVSKNLGSIKSLRCSVAKDVFINQYNFLVASEPACITFCQSSPFVDGRHFAKDCRTMLYRDLSIPGEVYGLYSSAPEIGGLPNYEFTLEDLRYLAGKRKGIYLTMLQEKGIKIGEVAAYPELKFMWGPIRINKIGTFECRGLDMNHPQYLFGVASLLKLALEEIKKQNLQTLPSDIGIKEPFKIEGDIVYLPPFSTVKSLELLSSRYGFDNSSVHSFCRALFSFVSKISGKGNSNFLSIIKKMLDEKKTVSDDILGLVRKNGYDPKNVPDEFLKYIAAYHAKKLSDEIEPTIKLYSSLFDTLTQEV